MSGFEDIHSSLLHADESNMNSQAFLPGLKNQDMKTSLSTIEVPVSDNSKKHSSSRQDERKLPYVCTTCNKSFTRKDNLKQHMMIHLAEKDFSCVICQRAFVRKSSLKRHELSHLKVSTQLNCDLCSDRFSLKRDLLKHRKIHKCSKQQHKCDECKEQFSRKRDLLKHKKIHKSPKQHKCVNCSDVFNRKSDLMYHVKTLHSVTTKRVKPSPSLKDMLYEKVKHFKRQNALNVFTKTLINSNEDNDKDFHVFFNSIRSDALNELNYQMEEKKRMKWYATVQVVVTQITQEGDLQSATPYFHSKTILELTNDNLSTHIDDAFAKINNSFEKFTQLGSGWTLEKILYLELSTAKYGIS